MYSVSILFDSGIEKTFNFDSQEKACSFADDIMTGYGNVQLKIDNKTVLCVNSGHVSFVVVEIK